MIQFASGTVSPHGVQAEILLALMLAEDCFTQLGVSTVVTSLTDGVHKADSLHYKGLAVDLRSRHLGKELRVRVLEILKRALPPYYEVYLEDSGGENEHFHIEYDYKGAS